jgi:hypothetical protein
VLKKLSRLKDVNIISSAECNRWSSFSPNGHWAWTRGPQQAARASSNSGFKRNYLLMMGSFCKFLFVAVDVMVPEIDRLVFTHGNSRVFLCFKKEKEETAQPR